MLAFSIDYYGVLFRATQSVGLFCTYEELIKIIKEADILFEKREEPFNIYEYCKK